MHFVGGLKDRFKDGVWARVEAIFFFLSRDFPPSHPNKGRMFEGLCRPSGLFSTPFRYMNLEKSVGHPG